MYRSLIEKKPVGMDCKSIASGLAPPIAGTMQKKIVFLVILILYRLLYHMAYIPSREYRICG